MRHLGGEAVVYDLASHRAHCLNRTATLVFHHADGRLTVPEIARAIAAEAHCALDEDVVRVAIATLADADLIEDAPVPAPCGSTRRAVLRLGLGVAFLAPAVVSLVVPTPAEAAATCIPKTSCTLAKYGTPCYEVSQTECASKICLDNNSCG